MSIESLGANREREVHVKNGWVMLPIVIGLLIVSVALLIPCLSAMSSVVRSDFW